MKKYSLLMIICISMILTGFTYQTNKITVFTIGDSTMADKLPGVYPETGWCQVISSYFDDQIVIRNHAVNGRSTKSFIDEGRWQSVLDSLKPGDYVFIQFGHNDQKQLDSSRFTNPYTAYRKNLTKFVNETIARGATPILLTSIVRRNYNDSGVLIDTHGVYPEVMREVAKEMNVQLIDLQLMTEELVIRYGVEGSKELYVHVKAGQYANYPEGKEDNTHLSEKGAREVASVVAREISGLPVSLAKYIKKEPK